MQPFARPSTPINRAQSSALYESPAVEKESHFGSENALRQAREASDNAVKEFEDNRTKIDSALEGLQYLVGNLKNGNRQDWPVRYPCLSAPAEASRHAGPSTRPGIMRRTMTYADDPNPIPVDLTVTPTSRQSFRRSLTMVQSEQNNDATVSAFPPPDACLNSEPLPEEDFSIMRLDLNLGATRQAKTLINRLEKASIASLLDNRFSAAMDHLGLLRQRIHDAHSRVLVTGDLNAGKSTLVNALLRRNEIMPTDEQPLTTRFVEVVNANENDGIEEIHVQDSKQKYDISDRASFSVEPIERLAEIISDAESDASSPSLTVYLKGNTTTTNPSILHNGVVEISLIDAPGLNRDSIKTTANFARQEEIDVVVFVVSAANHFTLSAKEFIWQAGHEKAHLFIVVNRFDQIRDKDRCRRLVLEQIKQLSPDTYKDAADLVHFVDSAKVAFGLGDDDEG